LKKKNIERINKNFELNDKIKKIKLTNESKIKNKNQENEDQILKK
jgi:hypothetical protein